MALAEASLRSDRPFYRRSCLLLKGKGGSF